MATQFNKKHLQIAGAVLLLALGYNVWYFALRTPAKRTPVAIGGSRAPQDRPAEAGPGAPPPPRAVDPMMIPPPPSVDLTTELRWVRNPFVLPEGARRRAVQAAVEVEADPVVNSILYSDERQLAIVDHKILRVGDRVSNGKIVEIERDAIVIDAGRTRRRIAMKPPVFGGVRPAARPLRRQ